METPQFKSFADIKQIGKVTMDITQKVHGTNAHILIYPDEVGELQLLCGSRTRWIYPGNDNYGFAAFVHANKEEFIKKLGVGRHDGEWAGPGINSGEGLPEKTFVLFDFWKFPPERPLPPNCKIVPVLYQGAMDLAEIETVMLDLLANGSKLVPGFRRPEGVVIQVMGTRYKKVFKKEETKWDKADENYQKQKAERTQSVNYSHLLQPVRLEKLLSRDETLQRDYPKSLPLITKAYLADLVKENQIVGSEGEIEAIKKDAAGQVFKFIKTFIDDPESFTEQLTA